MNQIKGVIFDMDGVVIDNHKYHFKAWMEFCEKYEFDLNEQIYREQFNGKTNADLFKMIFGEISPEQMKKYADEKEGNYRKIYADHMVPLRGLEDFLDDLRKRGTKVALGTSAPPDNVQFVFQKLHLNKYFNIVVDGTQVDKGKPDPQVYRLCASRLGLDPRDCIVFEDSLAGLDSGIAAGCGVVAVATSHKASELSEKTQNIISDFTEAARFIK